MGQRAAHETLYAIIGAFVKQRRWTQAALGREVKVSTAAVRKHLFKMKEDGFPLTEEKQPPHVVWRIAPDWFPGVLRFNADELSDLLRVVARSPSSASRRRVLDIIDKRLPLKLPAPSFTSTVRAPEIASHEDEWVNLFEDAARKKVAVRMHYTTASRRDDGDRHVSPHTTETGAAPRFLATCHRSGDLKWFRVAGVSNARPDPTVPYREADPQKVAVVLRETVDGFHAHGAPVRCTFFVRQPEAAWVKRNLVPGMTYESAGDGIRVAIDTPAVFMVAQFVVRHGSAARPETPELAAEVRAIATGALESARACEELSG
jgi:predicted DNA-binding transcriptional regulator YafY